MRKISIFDLDHTLLKANCSYLFGAYLYEHQFFSFFVMIRLVGYYALHKAGLLGLQKLHERIFKLIFEGKELSTLLEHANTFVDRTLQGIVSEHVILELEKAQTRGDLTAILSASPDFLVEIVASRLKVDEWRGTEYKLDKEQRFCHIATVMEGAEKAKYVKMCLAKYGNLKNLVTAYSDSHLDIPFLESAGQPIAVNPDRKLKRHSKINNWKILEG